MIRHTVRMSIAVNGHETVTTSVHFDDGRVYSDSK